MNYVILNKGSTPLLIEEIVALEIATTDFSNNPSRTEVVCKSQVLAIPGRAIREMFAHPGQKVLHELQNRPTLPEAFIRGAPPFPDDEKLDVAIYEPALLSNNEKSFATRAFSIEAGKASSLTATFDTDEAAWGVHNVMVICGAIKYLTSAGQETWVVCPASLIAKLYEDRKQTAQLGGPADSKSFTIGTVGSSDECGVRPSY